MRSRFRATMAMAIVAVLGAVTALVTAYAEDEASRLERKLDQGEMLALSNRRNLLRQEELTRMFDQEYNRVTAREKKFQKRGDELRAAGQFVEARLNDMQAEEETSVSRLILPFYNFVYIDLSQIGDLKQDEWPEKMAAPELRAIGFDVDWAKQPDGSWSLWGHYKAEVKHAARQVHVLSVSVVMFVLALACLTFAELNAQDVKREKIWRWLGYSATAIAVGVAVFIYHYAALGFLLVGVFFYILGQVGLRISRKQESLKDDESDEVEEPFEFHHRVPPYMHMAAACAAGKTFDARIVRLIVGTALLSSIAGCIYSWTSTSGSLYESEALGPQIASLRATRQTDPTMYDGVEGLYCALEARVRRNARSQRGGMSAPEIAEKSTPGKMNLSLCAMRAEWSPDLAATPKYGMDGPEGPDQDPFFPLKAAAHDASPRVDEALARWDGKNELGLVMHKRATSSLVVLTLFAIALYLFGLALSRGATRSSFVLSFLSVVLVAVGFIWLATIGYGATNQLIVQKRHRANSGCADVGTSRDDIIEHAAEHYAKGKELFATSTGADMDEEAANQFKCAVEARPMFALANYYYAEAMGRKESAQRGEAFINFLSKHHLKEIIKYDDLALAQMKDEDLIAPIRMLANQGFNKVFLGLTHTDPSTTRKQDKNMLKNGMNLTRQAIQQNHNDPANEPWLRFNLGVAYLAYGRKKEGKQAYSEGLEIAKDKEHTVAVAGEDRRVPDSHTLETLMGALTDLATLQRYCRQLYQKPADCDTKLLPDIADLRQKIMETAWPAPPEKAGKTAVDPKISDLNAYFSPSKIGWTAKLTNIDAAKDTFVALWYVRNADYDVWTILPQVSGQMAADTIAKTDSGISYTSWQYLRALRGGSCLPDGEYKLELYVNGKLEADSGMTPLRMPKLTPAIFRSLNQMACYPSDWKPWVPQINPENILARGYASADRGIYGFSYYAPKGEHYYQMNEEFIEKSKQLLVANGVIPSDSLVRNNQVCHESSVIDWTDRAGFVAPGFTAIARAWVGEDGIVNVGIVTHRGPAEGTLVNLSSSGKDNEDCKLALSLTTYK